MITKKLLERCTYTDTFPLRAMPKVDLHVHALLSAPFHTYQELSRDTLEVPPEKFSSLGDFLSYLRKFVLPCFDGIDSFTKVFRDCLTHMITDGIVYAEVSFPLMIVGRAQSSWSELAQAFKEELDRVSNNIEVRCEVSLDRGDDPQDCKKLLGDAIETEFFSGVDLVGDELARPIEEFDEAFSQVREAGMYVKIHSGEIGSAERMLHEVTHVRPYAVQHGIAASGHEELVKLLISKKIPLNICPYSNVALSIVEDYRMHPISELLEAGVLLTIGSDDYGIFGRRLSDEYLMLYQYGVLDADSLEKIRQNGLDCAGWSQSSLQ